MTRFLCVIIASITLLSSSLNGQTGSARDAAPGQTPPTARSTPGGSALVSGRVVTEGQQPTPVRLAFVTITGAPLVGPLTVVTADDGSFQFANLPAGRFALSARKVTFVDSAYGALGAGEPGVPIVVQSGQQISGLQLPLIAGAVISGTLRDANGLGIPDATVMAVRTTRTNGELAFRTNAPVTTTSDDRGAYRFFGLIPDDYVVVATPPGNLNSRPMQARTDSQVDEVFRRLERRGQPGLAGPTTTETVADLGRPQGYAPIFFPGTAVSSDANVVRLAAGEERTGLDIALSLVPTVTVTGTISAPGIGMPPVQLLMQPLGPQLSMSPTSRGVVPSLYSSNIGADGAFKYTNVPPGPYRLSVRTTAPVRATPAVATAGPSRPPAEGDAILWGMADFTVTTDDVSGLSIVLQPSLTITGRLRFDGSAPPPADLTTLRVGIGTGGGSSAINGTIFGSIPVPPAIIRMDGSFEFRNVVPGTYRLNITPLPSGWILRSALIDGRDIVDLPLEVRGFDMTGLVVRFTDRTAELHGTIQTSAGDSPARYVVVTLPADRTLWRPGSRWIRLARPSSDGAFSIDGLPGGEYLLALLTNATSADLERADFLEQAAAAAASVHIGEGEHVRQDLRVGR